MDRSLPALTPPSEFDQARYDYVQKNFLNLRGLQIVPLGFYFLYSGSFNLLIGSTNGEVPLWWGLLLLGTSLLGVGLFVSAIIGFLVIKKYYDQTYGARPYLPRRIIVNVVKLVGIGLLLAAAYIVQYALRGPSLVGLAAAGLLLLVWFKNKKYRRHYLLAAIVVAGLSFVPLALLSLPARYDYAIYGSLGGLLLGVALMWVGLGDHLLLARTLSLPAAYQIYLPSSARPLIVKPANPEMARVQYVTANYANLRGLLTVAISPIYLFNAVILGGLYRFDKFDLVLQLLSVIGVFTALAYWWLSRYYTRAYGKVANRVRPQFTIYQVFITIIAIMAYIIGIIVDMPALRRNFNLAPEGQIWPISFVTLFVAILALVTSAEPSGYKKPVAIAVVPIVLLSLYPLINGTVNYFVLFMVAIFIFNVTQGVTNHVLLIRTLKPLPKED